MADVAIEDFDDHGSDLIERVLTGEHITVTRAGEPVAELRPVIHRPLSSTELLERWARLPPIDPDALRTDIDALELKPLTHPDV